MASVACGRDYRPLPDHLVHFADFKREIVRLDYTADRLRAACLQLANRSRESSQQQQRAVDRVRCGADGARQRQLDDQLRTLQVAHCTFLHLNF